MNAMSVLAGAAAVAWLVAAVSALRLMAHRLPGRSMGWYAVRGYAFFSANHFAPEGRPIQRVFLLGVAGFAMALAAMVAVSASNIG